MSGHGTKREWKRFEDLPAALRCQILNAIDSAKGESAKSVYDRFGLAQRAINWHTFRRMVSERRKRVAPVPEDPSADVPTWEDLDQMMRSAIAEQVRAGNVKIYEAATVIGRCFDRKRLGLEEAAEERAAEKFEQWKRDLQQRIEDGERKLKDQGFTDETLDAIRAVYGIGGDDDGN